MGEPLNNPFATYEAVLRRPQFRRLWLSWTLSRLGDGIHEVALILLVWQLTGSASLMAVVAICSMVPSIALAFVGGAFADRYDRKRIMVFCDAGRGILVLGLVPLYLVGWLNPVAICAFAFLASSLETFFTPAQFAAIPATAGSENVQTAQALIQATSRLTQIIGPALGAALFGLVGAALPFAANAASFSLSAIVLSKIVLPDMSAQQGNRRLTQDMRAGFAYVRDNQAVMILLVMALLLNFGGAPLGIILPIFSEVLNSSAHAFGYMMAMMSAGMVLGFWQAGTASVTGKLVVLLSVFVGLAFIALSSTLLLPRAVGQVVAYLIIFVLGVLMGMVNVRIGAIMQLATDPAYLGRVGSVGRMFSLIASPLSLALFGPLVDFQGPGLALLICGFLIMLAGIPFIGSSMWRFRTQPSK
ncbi:MFS transporter [Candidatus Bipolaricaulota bacterium]